jgi:hypothetical protein
LLDDFAALLGTQVHDIEQALHASAPAKSEEARPSPFDEEAASSAIARLRVLLEASDGDTEEAFRRLQDAVAESVEKTQLDALSASINDFDFEAALVKLDEIGEHTHAMGDKWNERS